MLLIATIAGNTGWANLFAHHPSYGGKLPNYTTAAGGRSFPSSAGFNTSEFFFTDDTGVYFLPTRDMTPAPEAGDKDLHAWVEAHRARIVKLADGRLNIPAAMPHMEGHNTWVANVPGSTLVWPIADVAQHVLLLSLYLVQNGTGLFDDVNGRPIPGLERYAHRLDLDVAWPISLVDQIALTDVSVEMGTACYAGALMLQAMGLGGWMYTGINPFTVLGASGDPEVPGLGFRFEMLDRYPLPHVTGLPGVFEAHVPPHHASMRAAVEAIVARKYGAGGPFDPRHWGPLQGQRHGPGGGGRHRRRGDRDRGADGGLRARHLRPLPGHGAAGLHQDLPPGAPARHRVLRHPFRARRLPAHPRRARPQLGLSPAARLGPRRSFLCTGRGRPSPWAALAAPCQDVPDDDPSLAAGAAGGLAAPARLAPVLDEAARSCASRFRSC
jgi:hypothetical protein